MLCLFTPLQVFGYALIKNDRCAKVAYPMDGYSDDVAGRSFHHGEPSA